MLCLLLTGFTPTTDVLAQPPTPAALESAKAIDALPAGYVVAATRRTALANLSFDRPLGADEIRRWLKLGSQTTIAESELFLAPLSPPEQALMKKIEAMPAPIVNRLSFDRLRGVLQAGALLSLYEEEKQKDASYVHTTPAVEDLLFGAYRFVFASVGPPHGSPRYGDVVIRLKDSARENGWATPSSGMHFLWAVRHKDARKMQMMLALGQPLPADGHLSLNFDDRLQYSHTIVTEQSWSLALAYQAILVHRNLDDSTAGQAIRKRFEALLKEDDAEAFWAMFIPPLEKDLAPAEAAARMPFGYLEAKFADRLSAKHFESIEVPAEMLDDVRGWPEAKPYLHLIRAKPPGVK
jgi:hypothetical protein